MKRLTVYTNKGWVDKDGDESCSVFDLPLYVGDPADGIMCPDFFDAAIDMHERQKMMDGKPKGARKFVVVEQADD